MQIFENLHAFLWSNPNENNCNTYLINGDYKILIDPGHFHLLDHVLKGLSALSLDPGDIDLVIITHGHPDHMEGIKKFAGTSTRIAVSKIEMDFIQQAAPHYGEALGITRFQPDFFLEEGDLKLGDMNFRVINTPGHSPGSVCLYWPENKVLFTGDVVFNQGVGRTDLPGGNGRELKESIKLLSGLEVEHLLTGHGDIVSGRELVASNFEFIERFWFDYL